MPTNVDISRAIATMIANGVTQSVTDSNIDRMPLNIREAADTLRVAGYTGTAREAMAERSAETTAAIDAVADERPYVLMIGNPVDGIRLIGPFPDAYDAHEAGDRCNDDYWIVQMDAPDPSED